MSRLLAAVAVIASGLTASAQPAQPVAPPAAWKDWAPLIGEWESDVAGPGSPTGSFTLGPELQGQILVRLNRANYPAANGRPAAKHEDFMVIYREGGMTKASYWDNEGHVIRYVATVDKGKSVTFISEPVAGQPRFRLLYTLTGPKTMALRFEIAPPNAPEQFKPYIQATLHRAAR